ncbi:hypothetical protein J7K74_01480 [Candidatus Woesearchaeota archaeon]|nr:hypothetical protein [Candidatus Woesearchaeota archaeon]
MRKSVLFTITMFIVAIFIISIFLGMSYKDYYLESKIESIKVLRLNKIYDDYERYVELAVITSTREALNNLSIEIVEKESFLDNEEEVKKNLTEKINKSIYKWLESIKNALKEQSINVDYVVNDIYFTGQNDTWYVGTYINITLILESSIASWNHSEQRIIESPIEGLIDPLYTEYIKEIQGSSISSTPIITIKKSKYSFLENSGNYTKFLEFRNNHWYRATTRAPSFLQRFYNDSSNSTYGIESFMNESLLDFPPNTPAENRSYIDYMYIFGIEYNLTDLYTIEDVDETFRLDGDSVSIYLGIDADKAQPVS